MVDLNPLHYINKFNHMMGDNIAQGLEFLGISDPAVDPDGIREIAKKWRHLATGLDEAAEAAGKALAGVEWEGKAAKAFHKRSKTARKQATEMADGLREGAKALDDFADTAHELLTEIGVLLVEIAEFEIAGLALSVLTGGASAVVSSLMAGQRAAKVVALVARIEKEGTTLAKAIRTVMETIRAVERALKALKEIRGVAAAARMAKTGAQFAAFDTLLRDPAAFKDPDKLAGLLTEGALLGVGFGVLGKALGKGLKALKPAELAKLSKGLKLNCATFERLSMRPGFNKLPASIRNAIKTFVRDPIDVATGDMALPRADVELPGILPLVLERTHISSYRWGGWFGPSWASTLDQRVQADDEGLVYAAADGARICFPLPDPETNDPVRPETPGSRLALSWDDETDGAIRISDPDTGLTRVFHSPVTAADDTAVDLPLQHIQDRNGNRITIAYADGGDIPTAVVHSGGYHLVLDRHPSLPRITGLRLVDPDAPDAPGITLVTFGYDEDGHLTEEINSSGLRLRYTYDFDGRITSWTDRNGTTYAYTYDERGRVIRTEGSDGFLTGTLVYDDSTRTTTVTDSLGHVTRYEHNEALRLIRLTDARGQVTLQEWDDEHRLTAVTDPLGHTTRYIYGFTGQVTAVLRPDGQRTIAEYNELDLPTAVTAPGGAVWRLEYDERGNRTAVTDPSGATTRVTYNRAGHATSIVDAVGNTTVFRCDAVGRPVAVTDPLGAVTAYEWDPFGRATSITDPSGATTRLEWTTEGKLARSVAPDGAIESWTYDGEGNCTSHTDAMGAVSRFEYTHFDLMSARTGPDGSRFEFVHDTEMRLAQVSNPQGMTWTYQFDPVGNLVAETDFDGRTVTYEYDAAGLLKCRTNAIGQQITFERNELGQVVRKEAAGQITTFTYDPTGQLAQATGPETALWLLRDGMGRLREETVNGRSVTYTYDELGRRTGRSTPSGATSTWTYDAAGNHVQLIASGRSITFSHDLAGRELARHVGEALGMAHSYDSQGRLTTQAVSTASGRLIKQRTYAYRPDGNLVGIEDALSGQHRFNLDAAGRVTAVHAPNWTEKYAYDATGNQTFASWPATHPGQDAIGERTYEGTRVTRAGRVRYEYDALGRIVLRQKTRLSRKPDTWRYEWDAEDRLIQVTTPDGTRWRYTYDPLGRRTAKLRLGDDGEAVVERVDFTWDGTTLCEQTTTSPDLPNPVTLTWDHRGLHPIAQTERITAATAPQDEIDSRFFAIITDLVGTPSELVDEHGHLAWRARSALWGATAWPEKSTAYTPLRFPGQYYDPETGLHYNYFRHYDPETARYVSADPLGLEPAPNPSTYVHNPHTWTDPLGLSPYPPRIKGGGWDLRGRDPLSIIPDNAEMRVLKPHPNGGSQKGVEYKWTDPETGNTVRLRVHDKDGTAPVGSNAASGDVYRISVGGKYQDEAGNLHHRNVHNPNSPHYNPDAANDTHIPWPISFVLPY
ncbi:polymorphic toxin type 30 domain-containing protein [Streptomyces sp. 15-116A]|uniref:polymorphic toxin type 30 domain-containing protein n=1 Tax=Streptomyces sp. 15-116A TaxID=2259035 RepID=UPI0021B2BE7A|nr:polymorphic toxin type 30 domain-containing protein [Streptomyces sp. 15-116A]MCT7351318.1 polymorphic toxin type 30 domain-containing protein [Streptomyces sp. 15-116A]